MKIPTSGSRIFMNGRPKCGSRSWNNNLNMFALRAPMVFSCVPIRRKISRTVFGYYKLDKTNCQAIERVGDVGMFHILAFIKDGDTGIYSVKERSENGVTRDSIVAFRNFEDAFRYKTLLEAEVNMMPFVQFASRFELEHACNVGGYECLVVNEGALVTPPTKTLQITDWERRSALMEGRWSVREKSDD
jgi:hypothetical protein